MRLIDADEAIINFGFEWDDISPTRDEFVEFIKKQPTIEVEPVKHGRWIGAPICGNDNCRCSECGSWHNIHVNLRGEIMQKYCPNCGAKMDGDRKEGADNG